MLWAVALPSSPTAFVFSGTNRSLCTENWLCKSEQGGGERCGALIVSTADSLFTGPWEAEFNNNSALLEVLSFELLDYFHFIFLTHCPFAGLYMHLNMCVRVCMCVPAYVFVYEHVLCICKTWAFGSQRLTLAVFLNHFPSSILKQCLTGTQSLRTASQSSPGSSAGTAGGQLSSGSIYVGVGI